MSGNTGAGAQKPRRPTAGVAGAGRPARTDSPRTRSDATGGLARDGEATGGARREEPARQARRGEPAGRGGQYGQGNR